ncbi:ddb1 and cul4 associated factor 7 [Kappamyces sp. JEL0680]|nr:ddb1 and cul4 associated factor 7 [Kappamyces sp. JEL0680]
MYESIPATKGGKPPGLMRLEWNKKDANYIATFAQDSSSVIVLDVRVPAVPVFELKAHMGPISSISWAPHSSAHLCSGADDGMVFIWDISQQAPRDALKPIKQFQTTQEIANISWSTSNTDWIGVVAGDGIQVVPV